MTKLQIPNKLEMLFVVQAFVVESAKTYNLPSDLLKHLKLVTEEAFLHILKNSFADGEKSEVKVVVNIDSHYFRLSFFDKGLPFDSASLKNYKAAEDVESFDIEGMDLFIIKQYVDHIQWINHGSKGKEFQLLIELPNESIISILEKQEKSAPSNFTPEIEDVEVRLFRESDAIKIARTIYRAYGYTYPNEDLYYPEKITKLNKSGELISIVSFDKKRDEVVGHYALERTIGSPVAESGQAVVAPEYRGFNLMEKMRTKLEDQASKLNLEAILSQPVTTHVYSQKTNVRFQSLPCGFSFGLVPEKLSFRQINQSLSQRESCLTYYKVFKKRKHAPYIPQKHQKIIERIYQNMGLPLIPPANNNKQSNDVGSVKSVYSSSWGFGVITVEQLGSGNPHEIKRALHNLLFTMKSEVIFLYLPLEDGEIENLIDFIEKEKFFFSGLIPSFLNSKDTLRFEYLNGTIDDSKITIFEQEAKDIFNYVLNEKEKVLQ